MTDRHPDPDHADEVNRDQLTRTSIRVRRVAWSLQSAGPQVAPARARCRHGHRTGPAAPRRGQAPALPSAPSPASPETVAARSAEPREPRNSAAGPQADNGSLDPAASRSGPGAKAWEAPRGPRRRRRLRIAVANPRGRARAMFIAVLFLFSVFAAQLLRIQAFDASATQAAALSKRLIKLHTPAMRGQILDTNGQVLADSVERFTIAADPVAIQCYVKVKGECGWQGVHQAAADLAPKLGLDVSASQLLFTKPNTRYVIVKKDVTPSDWRQIQAVGVPGIAAERSQAPLPDVDGAGPARGLRQRGGPDGRRRRR